MTNKIEISRELAEVFAHGSDYTCAQMMGAIQQVRALLAAPAVERKSVPVVGMLIDGVVHYFKDEHLVSESGAIVPEADELYRKSPAVERQEPAFYAQYGHSEYSEDWRGVIKKEFDRRNGYTVPLYTSPPAPVAEGTTSDKYRAELYDEVWQKARDMGFNNVTDALAKLSAPVAVLHPELGSTPEDHMRWLLDKVVNPGDYPQSVLHDQIRSTLACLDKVKEMNK